jgi:hypothetical protein
VSAVHQPAPINGWSIDPSMPLHQLFVRRMERGRDLKVIITSKDSQTGTGKTTLAFWLARQWHSMYGDGEWQAEKHATLDVDGFLDAYRELAPGSVLLMDEAEQLDARRAMSGDNVDFSHYWMMMRFNQITSMLTLPTTSALDKRLKELADIWIEVQRRGLATVHKISVGSYENGKVRTPKIQQLEWPNVADHPEMEALDEMKQAKIDRQLDSLTDQTSEENSDLPKEVQAEMAYNIRKAQDCGWRKVTEHSDRLTFSGDYLRRVWNNEVAPEEENRNTA